MMDSLYANGAAADTKTLSSPPAAIFRRRQNESGASYRKKWTAKIVLHSGEVVEKTVITEAYTENNNYKESHEIICDLVDVVSKNGSLMLNIGPKSDGTIPEKDAHILQEIAKWLLVNGEGIYESYPWRKYGEGPTVIEEGHFTDTLGKSYTSEDFRFTFRDGALRLCNAMAAERYRENQNDGQKVEEVQLCNQNVKILGSEKSEHLLCDEYLTVMGDRMNTESPVCIRIDLD